ncbi:MAG TPA: hypothetical protein VK929_06140 [Longimicrobiales bacterium]|nr:hypothetical protein [Longimicrobiales bacterium]
MTEQRIPPTPPRSDSVDTQRPTPRDRARRNEPRPELEPTRTQDAAGHGKRHIDDDESPDRDGLSGPDPVSTDRNL